MKNITDLNFFKKLCTLPFVNEIWLYGSRARGDHRARSDMDICIICPSASDAQWQQIQAIIEEANTLLHIDLLRFDTLANDEPIKNNIMTEKIILFKRESHD